jgi:LuxR family transcriptional regulator, maltose regulon positive regulatory protein
MVDFPYKIVVPQRPVHLIARSRLVEQLRAIVDRRLITLSAPAGYGKTSLLIDFATSSPPLPICWYTLDSSDQDVWVFLHYLAAAVEHRFPGATARTQQLLLSGSAIAFSSALSTFVRDLYAIGQHFVIIIDDLHLVDHGSEIDEIISHLLFRCPYCHLMLASRSYPNISNLMLLAARRQMSSFNEQQLCFTPDEVFDILAVGADDVVTREQAVRLTTQAQGWITGILLLWQTCTLCTDQVPLHTISGERQIYRFLAEQVFDQQPADVQSFLLETSLLDELTPETCDTQFQRMDSRRLLDALLRRHLFVVEIKPGVLRYQPLFREFLQEQCSIIDPRHYRQVALNIADAYARQGQWTLSFERYLALGEYAAAQRVIASGGEQLYASGRLETLEYWFQSLPQEQFDVPLLCLKARVLLDRGQHAVAQATAELAANRAQPDDLVMVYVLQAQIARIAGDFGGARNLAQHVLVLDAEPAQRAAALRTLGICYHRMGQTAGAIEHFNQALALEQANGDLNAAAHIQRDLGICYTATGQLHLASDYFTRADSYWATTGNRGLQAMSLNSKGSTQHLMGHFQQALATFLTAMQYARDAGIPSYQATVLSNIGDPYSDLQMWDQAEIAYADAQRIGGSAYLMNCLALSQVRLLLRKREYTAAAQALRQLPQSASETHPHEIRLLRASSACMLQQYTRALEEVRAVIDDLHEPEALITLARAHLLEAQIISLMSPSDDSTMLAALDQALNVARQLNQDSFLVVEMLHAHGLQRRAAAAGWRLAEEWGLRQQDVLIMARAQGEHDTRPVLAVHTLGVDSLTLDDHPVGLGWNKAREVLYYLLAHPAGAHIDTLREAIWPNLPEKSSRDTLRSAIYQLRSVLPRELIILQGRQVYKIDRTVVRLSYDAERFVQLLDTCDIDQETLLEALDLYRGPFLASTESQWCASLRSYLEQRYMGALNTTAMQLETTQAYMLALAIYQRMLGVDILNEMAHTGVMRCWAAIGNRNGVITQYQQLRRILDEELGIEPGDDSEVEQLYKAALGT